MITPIKHNMAENSSPRKRATKKEIQERENIVYTQLETLMPENIREMYLLAETQDRARIRMALSEF